MLRLHLLDFMNLGLHMKIVLKTTANRELMNELVEDVIGIAIQYGSLLSTPYLPDIAKDLDLAEKKLKYAILGLIQCSQKS